MNSKIRKIGFGVLVLALVASGTVMAAVSLDSLQYPIHDEYNTGDELNNAYASRGLTIMGTGSSAYLDVNSAGGVDENFTDGDLAEFQTSNYYTTVLNGQSVAKATSGIESQELTTAGVSIGPYREIAINMSITDDTILPIFVDSGWSSSGTLSSGASVNSNNNLVVNSTESWTSNSFTISGDAFAVSSTLDISTIGTNVSMVVQSDGDGDGNWSNVKSTVYSSAGSHIMSLPENKGTYRVKVVAQGGSSDTTVNKVTFSKIDPAEPVDYRIYEDRQNTDTSDDQGVKIEVGTGGNVDVTYYDNSANTSQTVINSSLSEVNASAVGDYHSYKIVHQYDSNVTLYIDGKKAGSATLPTALTTADDATVAGGNGVSITSMQVPTQNTFRYESDVFTSVSKAQEGFARVDINESRIEVSVYGVDVDGSHFVGSDVTTVTKSEASSTVSGVVKHAIADTASDYPDYKIVVSGAGDAKIRSVGVTSGGTISGIWGTFDDATGGRGVIVLAGVGLVVLYILFKSGSGGVDRVRRDD